MAMDAHLSIVLHAHLPFVRHPEHEYHLEEMWFYEAMHETYLPLLQALDRLDADGVPGILTLSLSPPLLAMMKDELLRERFIGQMDRLTRFSEQELAQAGGDEDLERLAAYYHGRFAELRRYFVEDLDGDVIGAFGRHGEKGRLELMTCVGTHPIMPFMATDEGKRAQIRVGIAQFEACFGRRPRGIWLPECAFAPGIDRFLAEEGIGFVCLEENGIVDAESAPVYDNYSPLISPSGVAFFGRDQLASSQVWSASEGYPGDYDYREFYRDRGYDLPIEEVAPFIHPDGIRHHTGLKYHRITGDVALDEKEFYRPAVAAQRAKEHAAHFVYARRDQGRSVAEALGDRPAHMTCPYDAELYGHWWFEGPLFLEHLIREAAKVEGVKMSTPAIYIEEVGVFQETMPAQSTWGEGSYFSVWLDESNAWTYRYLRRAEEKMVELARENRGAEGVVLRALKQAARELVLAQSSDWPFIMKTGTTVEYAEEQVRVHLENFTRLAQMVEAGEVDEEYLRVWEERDNLFPWIDPGDWAEG